MKEKKMFKWFKRKNIAVIEEGDLFLNKMFEHNVIFKAENTISLKNEFGEPINKHLILLTKKGSKEYKAIIDKFDFSLTHEERKIRRREFIMEEFKKQFPKEQEKVEFNFEKTLSGIKLILESIDDHMKKK
jgi:hypothetical protein